MKKEISSTLVKKFLENKCNREEAEIVYDYLTRHPMVLDDYFDEASWDAFHVSPHITEARSNAWLEQIQAQKQGKKIFVLRSSWWRVAAMVLLMAGIGCWYWLARPAAHPAAPLAKKAAPAVPRREKWLVNNNSEPIEYTLDDGTVVRLQKNSLVACNQPFDKDKRTLRLQGEAIFYVAKDKKRPFTVFTDGFSTEALGTVFRVKAYPSGASAVKLLRGKVVVRNLQSAADPVYLLPGDECSFNNTDHRLYFHGAIAVKPAPVPEKVTGEMHETEDEVSFSNTPLPQVLAGIGKIYHIPVACDSGRVNGRTFTGSFLKRQPVEEVLATIAQLNNLTVSKAEAGYRLTAN